MSEKTIRLSLDLSPALHPVRDDRTEKTHSSKSEIGRKSVARREVALEAKQKGNHLAIVNKEQKMIKERVGL